jgi:hypothetical protein
MIRMEAQPLQQQSTQPIWRMDGQDGDKLSKRVPWVRLPFTLPTWKPQRPLRRSTLSRVVVAPFSKDKIQDYIRQYVQRNESTKESTSNHEDYWHTIESITTPEDLVKNPFLLTLALEVLPNFIDLTQDLSLTKISSVTLYDYFLEQWVERGEMRLVEREMESQELLAFDAIIDDGFSKNAIGFVKDLAVAIFERQNGNPVVTFLPFKDRDTWKAEFFGFNNDKSLLRETSPLSRLGNQYRFIHRSILVYGLTRAVFEPLSRGKSEQGDQGMEGEQSDQGMEEEPTSPLYRTHFLRSSSF